MMTAIGGEWGTGKTKMLAELLEKNSKAGAFCVSNFSHALSNLDCSKDTPEEFIRKIGMIVEFKMLGHEPSDIFMGFKYSTICIFIDEGTLYFSPEMQDRLRKRNEEIYDRLQSLIAQVRKFDISIYYTVQNFARIGKDFRRLTDDWIYLRWAIPMRKFVPVLHPTKRTIRMEMRNRIRILWVEHHDIDPENPILNYKLSRNPDTGNWELSENSTLVHRKLSWDIGRDYIFKMYDSFQPMGIGGKTGNVDLEFLKKETAYVVPDFGKEWFPWTKKLLKKLGLKVKMNDEVLPPKIFFDGIKFTDDSFAHISSLDLQEKIVFDRELIHRSIYESLHRKGRVSEDEIVRRAVHEVRRRPAAHKEGAVGGGADRAAVIPVEGE